MLRRWFGPAPVGPRIRGILRLSSALVLLSFVICHLSNHALATVSVRLANDGHAYLIGPWRTTSGSWLLLAAATTHYTNAVWSVFVRRSFRLPIWQFWQLGLGLSIPVLWILHFCSTRLAESLLRMTPDYTSVLVNHWVVSPWLAVLQISMLLTVWTHACIGINYWLGAKAWYPIWRVRLLVFATVLPTLALAGYVSGGQQVRRNSDLNKSYTTEVLEDTGLTGENDQAITRFAAIGWTAHLLLITGAFAGRSVRRWIHRSTGLPLLSHPSNPSVPLLPGATILESLQFAGIAHASVCGGRGRCTTCRVRVLEGFDNLPPPGALEARALRGFRAEPRVRLACQTRPGASVSVAPLLPASGKAALSALAGDMAVAEQLVTVVFLDLRGSTRLAESKLPYDVMFILNQFFQEMIDALAATKGHYANFTGDGLMALYGLGTDDPGTGARAALRGAAEMLSRLAQLNRRLDGELAEPLRIGIGIHSGVAIIGSLGPPQARNRGALGDTVNTAARLESLCKDYDSPLILSKQAADLAGLTAPAVSVMSILVKGKERPVEFFALSEVPPGFD